ncbi:hypothetical protein [Marinirhabdus gelatinilytica]|uniref:Chloroplast import component protein (Tic20) n=1 Tax=Marinirhabdus gelatinilytica TaxID=1703343 RepID=A0A370QAK7_9FLAO|nr:hypothetical protein [Marinirhabdus gelatinilytica]RDK85403.1 hypothetical protein C8D94_103228 [Marinirhabdus gelatinilytica]
MSKAPAGKTKAIIAYITFIGFFIAVSMNKDKPEAFATWHIKNMFGLLLLLIIAIVTQFNIHLLIGDTIYWSAVVLWGFSLTMAISGKKAGIPFFSKKFQTWFTFLG